MALFPILVYPNGVERGNGAMEERGNEHFPRLLATMDALLSAYFAQELEALSERESLLLSAYLLLSPLHGDEQTECVIRDLDKILESGVSEVFGISFPDKGEMLPNLTYALAIGEGPLDLDAFDKIRRETKEAAEKPEPSFVDVCLDVLENRDLLKDLETIGRILG